jgi:hypothetical protein
MIGQLTRDEKLCLVGKIKRFTNHAQMPEIFTEFLLLFQVPHRMGNQLDRHFEVIN